MTIRVDSHQHFWDRSKVEFDHSWQEADGFENICRSFLPDDLRPQIQVAGIDYTVFVQTQHNLEENRWALTLSEQNSFICGVVGWVDLTSSDCQSQLLEFKQHPKFVGVRHITQDEPDDDFILRQDVLRGLSTLQKNEMPFDLLFYSKHLRHVPTIARQFPNLRLVIDHLSKPEIKHREYDQWRKQLAAAANCENVWCKLSGMVTEADWQNWTIDDLRPYAEAAIELFGPLRLMFGSDWPVCKLAAADYAEVVGVARQLISGLSQEEQNRIMGESAIEFYQLDLHGNSRET